MKLLYTALVAVALPALAAQADDATHHYLREINASQGTESWLYTYNESGQLTRQVHTTTAEPNTNTRTDYVYNEKGLNTLVTTYQNLEMSENPDDYILVIRMEYDFNDRNQISSYSVYNYAGPGADLALSSVYNYEYASDGKLTRISIVPDGFDHPTQVFDFTYDTAGRVSARDMTHNGTLMSKNVYTYNEADGPAKGKIKQQINYTHYPQENRLGVDLYVDYVYDQEGHLTSIDEYNNTRLMLLKQFVYLYDAEKTPFTMDEAVYPANYDDEMFGAEIPYYTLTNAPMYAYEERAFNEFSGLCELVDVFNFTYLTYPDLEPVAIETVSAGRPVGVTVNGGRIYLDSAAATEYVNLTDASGRIVYSGAYGAGIDASRLAKGVYVVATPRGAAKIAL